MRINAFTNYVQIGFLLEPIGSTWNRDFLYVADSEGVNHS
jgi:hypothetical protein